MSVVETVFSSPKNVPSVGTWVGQMKDSIYEILKDKEGAFKHFHHSFWFLKGFGTIFLLVLMIWNMIKFKDFGLITSKPGMFVVESIVFSLCTVIPFAILSYMRNTTNTTATTMMILGALFIGFFILNFILEMSGIYKALFEEKKEDKPVTIEAATLSASEKLMNNIKSINNLTIITVFIVPLIVCILAALLIHNVTPHYQHFVSDNSPWWQQLIVFLVETGLFATLNAVPVYLIAHNRNAISKHTSVEFGLITAKFSILHIFLQLTGFYSKSFNNKI